MDASVYIFTLCLKLYMLFIRRDVKPTFNAASLIPDCCYSQCILRTSVCVSVFYVYCVSVCDMMSVFEGALVYFFAEGLRN